jgi:hypothetical protein
MDAPQERQLVIILADISGYTRFMIENQAAAVHGQMCIKALIETMLREVDIPLRLQEIEGDALFLYAAHPGEDAGWQDVLAQVRTKLPRFFEAFFAFFVPAAEATPCGCGICKNLKDLKLKVIVHVGRAVFHEIAGRPQISGTDVILAHRLLKNSQPHREYLLMTDAAYRGVGREMGAAFERGAETYDGFGSVGTWVQRLDGAVQRERDAFYALPPGAFRARIASYAGSALPGMLSVLAGNLRRPIVAASWLRRLGYALRVVVEAPFVIAFIVLAQPARLRARRAAELRARSSASTAP